MKGERTARMRLAIFPFADASADPARVAGCTRRRALASAMSVACLAFAAVAACPAIARAAPADAKPSSNEAQRPNIVLIVSDDHGVGDSGAYGNRAVSTPNLDALARDSLRFTHAFATTSSCSPSRSTLLTGRVNHNNGMYGLQHGEHHFSSFDNVKSLPVLLKAKGYRTARIGKYHLAPESVYAFDQAIDRPAASDAGELGRSPVEMADLVAPFIRGDGPFFLYFATDDPHRAAPFDIGDRPNSFGNRAQGHAGVRVKTYAPADVVVPPFLPDTPAVRAELAQYYQSVSRMDAGLGRLIAQLKAAGKYRDTLIIYTTDNGVAFPNAKTNLYDSGVHVPLLVRAPDGGNAGATSDAMVSLADVTPTILDFAGLDFAGMVPGDTAMDGRSFRAVVAHPDAAGWEQVYGTHSFHEVTAYYPMRMVRTRRYKLIHNLQFTLSYPIANDLYHSYSWQYFLRGGGKTFGPRAKQDYLHRPEYELYDVEKDPLEIHNLYGQPQYAVIEDRLKKEIVDFQIRTKDPWLNTRKDVE